MAKRKALFPGETAKYRAARNRLLRKEITLRRALEKVAAQRRTLPLGGAVPEDYVFQSADGPVRLSELFDEGKDTLLVYNFMFGPQMPEPCPYCTSILDSVDGAAPQPGNRGPLAHRARADVRARARMAAPAAALVGRQQLQPRLSRRERGRRPAADDERLRAPPRARPPRVGNRAVLRRGRSRTGQAPRRSDLAGLEPAGHDAGRTRRDVGAEAALLTVPRSCCLARAASRKSRSTQRRISGKPIESSACQCGSRCRSASGIGGSGNSGCGLTTRCHQPTSC